MFEMKTFESRGAAGQYVTQRGYRRVSGYGYTDVWEKDGECAEVTFTPGESSRYVVTFLGRV